MKKVTTWLQASIVAALTLGLFTPATQYAGIGIGKYPGKCAVISEVQCKPEPNGRKLKMCYGRDVEVDDHGFVVPSLALVNFKVDKVSSMPGCSYSGKFGSTSCISATVECTWRRIFDACPDGYQPPLQHIAVQAPTTVPNGNSLCPAYKAGGSSVDSTDYQK